MKAELLTYDGEILVSRESIELPDDYDDDCYGETVPFAVGSNQSIVVIDS